MSGGERGQRGTYLDRVGTPKTLSFSRFAVEDPASLWDSLDFDFGPRERHREGKLCDHHKNLAQL